MVRIDMKCDNFMEFDSRKVPCNHKWIYKGKRKTGQYVFCPACGKRVLLR